VKRLLLTGLIGVFLVKFTDRGRRAQAVYRKEIASGARPIEAVGTAVAAFVGLAPGGPVNTP
jgi:UPF0716 family protein affecting phage T7 exclusion